MASKTKATKAISANDAGTASNNALPVIVLTPDVGDGKVFDFTLAVDVSLARCQSVGNASCAQSGQN